MGLIKNKLLELVDDFETRVTDQVMNDPAFGDKTQKEVNWNIQRLVWRQFSK
jgi:hypothetical protein